MIVSFGQPYITFKVSADVTREINASDLYERHLSSSCLENRKFLNLFNSDWEKLQSERLFLSAVKLFIKCCPRNIYEVPNLRSSGKRLYINFKIHGICRS